MLESNPNCAHNLLEIEYEIYSLHKNLFAHLWLERTKWPVSRPVVSYLFEASEIFRLQNNEKKAQQIWTHLVDTLDDSYAEKTLSHSRLDTQQTESQKLWKH